MQRQRILATLIVLLVIVGLVLFIRGNNTVEEEAVGEGEGVRIEDVVSDLSNQLGVSVPENVERISLADVTGGSASGLATRDYEDGRFTHTVLAALPDLEQGMFYQGWLLRGMQGEENFSLVNAGRLRPSKGGYLLEFSTTADLRDHSQVVVTLEGTDDENPETHILEGGF